MADVLLFPSRSPSTMPRANNEPLPDAVERAQALDVRTSWIVEAPAGSGKTGLLIQRFLKLLGDEGVAEPEEVLAITFTRKATAEMRQRVVEQMEMASTGAKPKDQFERETRVLAQAVLERDRERSWGLLENPRRLKIMTIDAVCAEICRSLPVVSGSGGGISPVDDAEEFFHEAARRTVMRLGAQDEGLSQALRTMLLHRDGDLGGCERLIAEMLAERDQWGRLIPLGRELNEEHLDKTVLPRLEKALDLAICQALTQLNRSMPQDVLRQLTAAAEEFAHFDGHQGAKSYIAMCANLHASPGERAEHLEHWRALIHLVVTPSSGTWRKAFAVNYFKISTKPMHTARLKRIIDQLRDRDDVLDAMCRLDTLPPAIYPHEQWIVAKALFRVLSHALVELQMVFAERGQCDFAELGLAARAALTSDTGAEDLAAVLGTRTRHLLVDEMQDTSSSQYELIERLTQGWDGRSQTIFLVGDPKQSIYRFRQARVERFVRTMKEERLGGLKLGCLRLTANFRSQRALVDRFNEDFAALFPPAVDLAHPEEVPFCRASAVRDTTQADSVIWHPSAIERAVEPAQAGQMQRKQALQEAREMRRIALRWLRRPLPDGRTKPWRIAVLLRSRRHLGRIVEEFKRVDRDGTVPFRATQIDALGERQEVLDLVGLTRALLHPADRVAWFAVLHAPWCGLGLADLHVIAGSDDLQLRERCVMDLVRERGHLLSEEGEERLGRVWPVLEAARDMRGRHTVAQMVEKTWRSLGGDAYLDAPERANADRFFLVLDELEAMNGTVDLAQLKRRVTKLYAESEVNEETVDIMTIHKAKGLEWDVVMIPGLERRPQGDRGHLLEWMEVDSDHDDAAHVVLAPIAGKGEDSTQLHQWIRSIDAAREAAERKRLLYVACTRAREELHLFAAPSRTRSGEIAHEPNSLLKTAWPIARAYFENAPRASESPMVEEGDGLALAASGESETMDDAVGRRPLLHRLPSWYDPLARFAPAHGAGDPPHQAPSAAFDRPEGSLAARAFGNAVHAFLQIAAEGMAHGTVNADALAAEIPGWRSRVEAVLRGDGLAPAVIERSARRVIEALMTTLRDPDGRWLLAPHPGAANEVAMTGWTQATGRLGVRLDRMFQAGRTPRVGGEEILWIVDYKTATHGAEGLDDFLETECMKYRAQLETYARSVSQMGMGSSSEMRVALYYPVLGRLIWWVPDLP